MKKSLIAVTLALALTACSSGRGDKPLEVWQNFESSKVTTQNLSDKESLVVFYRLGDIEGPAVNVYVNQDYQASLLPNAFSPISVCAAKNVFSSSSFTSSNFFGNRTEGAFHTSSLGQVMYLKVIQESNGKLNFVRVDNAVAEQEIAQLPKENQTLSRVRNAKSCDTPVLATQSLDANALFAFNKFDYKDISSQGKQDITAFAQRISTFGHAAKIVVSGHTDPSGNERYNQVLSQKRAETVKVALQRLGVSLPIEAVGYGKSQPVVTHCGSLKGKAQQACNQPNRRVEITIYGNR